jgi:glutamate/tyrosine decarboxylase-like PLP-dependent enzyme
MLDDMFDYLEQLRQRPTWQPAPAEVRGRFAEPLPREASELAAVHDTFMQSILPYVIGNAHPGFMGWVHGGGTPVGMLAEMLAAGLNANLGGRNQVPLDVERQILQWARELFGFPEAASGLFVTGTSMANLISLMVARTAALGVDVRRSGVAAQGKRLTAYASAVTHSCIARAIDIAGIGTDALRLIPVNERHEIDLATLKKTVAADQRAGCTPFFIVGNAGTVDIGAIDDLAGLADFAGAEKIWFHVDGAFGGLAMLASALAPRLKGIERADSIGFDFHKWAQVPYDAGFVMVRDGALHQATFVTDPSYLRRDARGMAAHSPWPCDFGPDLSRGFRALKTWFTLKVYGSEALGQVIAQSCSLAQEMARRIEASAELELLAPVALNIVCFRFRSADADRVNAEILVRVQESGVAAPSSTSIDGRFAIRAALFNHRTTQQDVDAMLDAVISIGRRVAAEPAASRS